MLTARLPVGTVKETIIALNGVPHVVCETDRQNQLEPIQKQYYDAAGNPVDDVCDGEEVDLRVKTICCGDDVCLLIPDAVIIPNASTPLFTSNYPNDGTPVPDLALAGDVLVAYTLEATYTSPYEWDNASPEPPAGYYYQWAKVVSPDAALAAAV